MSGAIRSGRPSGFGGTAGVPRADRRHRREDAEGHVICYAVNVQDLTERRRAEEQVRQAQKMEAVGRLAGGVAHDFNNMMMIIMGFSDFLLTTLDRTDPRWADADEIRKAAERAMHLTRQLLGFGRQQLVARHVLSLNEVVAGMERMLRPLLGEDIRLVTRLSVGLGGVEADYGQMEQVVMNLALNARDAMRGGGRLTIETLDVDLPEGYAYRHVGLDIPPGPYVMLVVSDTGARHEPGGQGQALRAVLHHQARHPEHRPRPGHGLRHRRAERGLHLGRQRA